MNKLLILFCSFVVPFTHAMEQTPAPATTSAQVRVLVLGYGYVTCMRDKNIPAQLSFPGGVVDPKELAINAACRKLKAQTGLIVAPESIKLIGLLNRIHTQGTSEYCHYYFANQKECEREVEDPKGDDEHLFISSLDELLLSKTIFSRISSEPHLQISQEIKKIVQHLQNGCKRSETLTLLDPRQFGKPKEIQDKSDVMILELFAQQVHESELEILKNLK